MRRQSRQIMVGNVPVGGDAPITVQTMTNTPTEDVGATIRLAMTGNAASIEAKVREGFNPALYNKSKERVENSHYFVKDFNPLKLGSLRLKKGRGLLRLTAPKIVGKQAIDVHSIELVKSP